MNPTLFGLEHLLYIFISTLVGTLSVLITFKYVKKEDKKEPDDKDKIEESKKTKLND